LLFFLKISSPSPGFAGTPPPHTLPNSDMKLYNFHISFSHVAMSESILGGHREVTQKVGVALLHYG